MYKEKTITLNGFKYQQDSKCPACSSEVDKGGRLQLKKRVNYFLTCNNCKYTIKSARAVNKQENYMQRRRDKATL